MDLQSLGKYRLIKLKRIKKVFGIKELEENTNFDSFFQSASPILLEDRLRVFYCTRKKLKDGTFVSFPSFFDLSIKDEKFDLLDVFPSEILPLGEKGTFDEFGINPISVVSSENKLKMYYAGWTRCESVHFDASIGYAISNDNGKTFIKQFNGPIIGKNKYDKFLIGSPKIKFINQTYYLTYVSGKQWLKTKERYEPVYKLKIATSKNGIDFKICENTIIKDIIKNECQASGDIINFKDKYIMLFSFRDIKNYKNSKSGYKINYAISNDLISWERSNHEVLFCGESFDFDQYSQSYLASFNINKKTFVLYQGDELGKYGLGIGEVEFC